MYHSRNTEEEADLRALGGMTSDLSVKKRLCDELRRNGDVRAELLAAELRFATIVGPANVHGVFHVEQALGVTYSPEHLRALARSSECVLPVPSAFAKTHILVVGYPISLAELHIRHADLFFNKADTWFTGHRFAHVKVGLRWLAVRKEPVPGSIGKEFRSQLEMLPDAECVPRACELAYVVLVHSLVTGERLLGNTFVRCRDRHPQGGHVDLGDFTPDGMILGGSWDGHRSENLGLASRHRS